MCSDYKELIIQLIKEGDLWETLGLNEDEELVFMKTDQSSPQESRIKDSKCYFSIHLRNDIGDLTKKFTKLIEDKIYVQNDTEWRDDERAINKRWALGGFGIVTRETIKESKDNGKRRYRCTGFDSGHILAQRLFRKNCTSVSLNYNNVDNIYPQTKLSNEGSTYGKGNSIENQTYFESWLEEVVDDTGKEYFYRAKLVYGKDDSEIVPRGIRLQAVEIHRNEQELTLGENTLFNVFVPNITKEGLLNYHIIEAKKDENGKCLI